MKKNDWGYGLYIVVIVLSILLSFVVPFFWFIVGCLIIVIIGKLFEK